MQLKIHNEGWIYLVSAIILTIIVTPFFVFIGIFFAILSIYIFYFFRDPNRKIIYNEQNFLSPADGRIVSIKEWEDPDVGRSTKIAIFLSFLNVHRQWIPLNAKVLDTFYNPGRFFRCK